MTSLEERKTLLEQYIKRMEVDHGIKENTTDKQRKNGTRSFITPAGNIIASYKSGYVRRCTSFNRIYQLNKVYKRKYRYTILNGDILQTREYMSIARELIYDPLARLLYIVEFCKRNNELKK